MKTLLERIKGALDDAPDLPEHVEKIMQGFADRARRYQMNRVNGWVNRELYRSDRAKYGVSDHWARPKEFFGSGGDCEDYAVGKYHCLIFLGWKPWDLKLVVVRDNDKHVHHAVLYARCSTQGYPEGAWFILDNQHQRPLLRAKLEATRYLPLVVGWDKGVATVDDNMGEILNG